MCFFIILYAAKECHINGKMINEDSIATFRKLRGQQFEIKKGTKGN